MKGRRTVRRAITCPARADESYEFSARTATPAEQAAWLQGFHRAAQLLGLPRPPEVNA